MSENEDPQLGVHRIVMPWSDLVCEEMLRRKGGSFTVAWGWSIAWSGTGWQVFFQGVCADELTREHETFRVAYESIEGCNMNSIETRLHDAKLATAIGNACKVIPSDCEIVISLQQGAGVVSLWVDGAETEFPSTHESLAETIDDAVDYAQSMNG